MKSNYFISVDWGTSNFRLRLADKSSGIIVEELNSTDGVKSIYEEANKSHTDRTALFLKYLNKKINQLNSSVKKDCEIIISGMASSSMGICELDYAQLPFQLDGKGIEVYNCLHQLIPQGFYLVSGICSSADIMRGEETQLIGLAKEEDFNNKSLFILPGTHSKHIDCDHGTIVTFRTYMTGEMFHVTSNYSLLKDAVWAGEADESCIISFEEGVMRSLNDDQLLNDLFTIRVFHLLKKKSREQNYYFLSGLLIGAEIRNLNKDHYDQIKLCAGNHLHSWYHKAINISGLDAITTIIDQDLVDTASVRGHLSLLNKLEVKNTINLNKP